MPCGWSSRMSRPRPGMSAAMPFPTFGQPKRTRLGPRPRSKPTAMSPRGVEIRDPKFTAIVGEQVTFEQLGSGFLFTEGPLWHARDQYLLFSDMPGNQIRRWSAKTGIEVFRKPS